ncbi:MAG: hypothetical protein KA375_14015 [Vitreoscilla sp.]|nr:hypothetical protein [Vitreoscilla sp.]MBP6675369.1 hypothetical protein [Vitreoscilla sp.]
MNKHALALLVALTTAGVSLLACAGGGSEAPRAGGPAAQAWVTTADRTRLLALDGASPSFGAVQPLAANIEVDAATRYQTMAGFGAAITDASAWLITNRMSATQRDALMQELFGRAQGGVGFDFTRLTIGASDFSRSHYSFDDQPAGGADLPLAKFSIDAQRADVLPVVKQALAINPELQVMASPWSAPGWMKTTDSLIKGELRPDRYDAFARYLVRYVDAFATEGVPIFALTIQNEPNFEPGDYPGMKVTPAQRAEFVGKHLGPLLEQRGLKTQVIDWDHNWNAPDNPLAVLADPVARRYISGVAWHCYEGAVSAQGPVHDAYPDKDAWFTECSGGQWEPKWEVALPWMTRNVVIGSARGWARGALLWNLALDENFGPHLGGCKDCRGVVTIDSKTGVVTRNLEYYALAHASKFVRQGAQRIASTGAIGSLDNVAFRNADDGSIVLVVCNSAASEQRFSVRYNGQVLHYSLPAHSVATLVWAA